MKNIFIFGLLITMCVVCEAAAEIEIKEMYKQCKEKKIVCTGMPQNCWTTPPYCRAMATIKPNLNKSKMEFKLVGVGIPDVKDSYVAIGIAENDEGMKDTSIILCTASKISVFWSKRKEPLTNVPNPGYFKGGKNLIENGNVICDFELNTKFTESGKGFDLANKNYAVQFAIGDFKQGLPNQHKPEDRDNNSPMSLTDANATPPVSSSHLCIPYLKALLLFVVELLLI